MEEDTKRWYWLAIAIAGVVMASLIVLWQQSSGGPASLMDRVTGALVAVLYFDSRSHPDGDGVLFVLERHRDWDAGVLICRQRNSEWQGVHLNGQIMSAGPDFGFRRLHNDGMFWHWYRRSWAATNKTGLGVLRQEAAQTRKGAL